jgi:hypothetical protein
LRLFSPFYVTVRSIWRPAREIDVQSVAGGREALIVGGVSRSLSCSPMLGIDGLDALYTLDAIRA